MKTIKLYLGLNDKDLHRQKYDMNINKKILMNVLKSFNIDCYTLQLVEGVYKDEIENTYIITISNTQYDSLYDELASELANTFNQECVMVECYETVVNFR